MLRNLCCLDALVNMERWNLQIQNKTFLHQIDQSAAKEKQFIYLPIYVFIYLSIWL